MKRIRMGRVSLAMLTFLIAGATAVPSHAAITTNLALNPSFESGYLPPNIVHQYLYNQPVWPTNWLAEGATELFDHTPNAHKNGEYSAGISGSWSGPRWVCETSCIEVAPQRDTAYQVYSVAPAWRSQAPIPVTAGSKYTFSAWMKLTIPKTNTGAVTKVRWLNSLGVPFQWSAGPSLIAALPGANYSNFIKDADGSTPKEFIEQNTPWTYKNAEVTAPAGATGAILLLGYTDDAWIGSVNYDQICFTPKPANAADDICKSALYAT